MVMKGTPARKPRPNIDLITLRLKKGLSRRQLADKAGLTGPTIGRAEDGYLPSPESQRRIGDVLEVDHMTIWPIGEQKVRLH